MSSNSTGKWVARAASTGGGRTYRGQMPVNWYASLVIIVIVGLLLVGFSRYQRTHPSASSSGPPTTSQTWHNALGIDICGKLQPNLPASTNTSQTGLTANGSGLVVIAPKNSSESGGNATLGRFVSKYKGLVLTESTIQSPGQKLMSNGDRCPQGTPDAGKQGYVVVDTWPNFSSPNKPTEVSGDPAQYKFVDGQMITMAFLPATATVPKPQASAITALINAVNGTSTTSTTAPTTSTTAPPSSTTTTPSTTTTVPATSTTAPRAAASTTTTTAKHPSGSTK